MDDTGQFPIGMPRASPNDELNGVMSGDRYLVFIETALGRFRRLSEGRAALARGDVAGGLAQMQALGAEVIRSFQRDSADMARFRANLQTSTAPSRRFPSALVCCMD